MEKTETMHTPKPEVQGCETCEEIARLAKKGGHLAFGPRHRGSRYCRSGSIASGGSRAHCTCDTCF